MEPGHDEIRNAGSVGRNSTWRELSNYSRPAERRVSL